jgi:hypothetical protein
MKWTEYPTTADHTSGRNGTACTGQTWADGPRAGTQWVIPDGDDSHYALVHRRADGKSWSVPADNYLRRVPARAGTGEGA